jgi:Fic family protein
VNLKDFQAGVFKKQTEYRSFSPAPVNQTWVWDDPAVNVLLEKATRALSSLDAYSLIVPDVDLFIHMHITKEANSSSRIEGTKTELDEAVMDVEDIAPEKRDDWQEVRNYVDAINSAVEELKILPLSNRLLRSIHGILMRGVRGERKYPGEFRKSQNWIGGSGPSDAFYVPPHWNEVPDLMGDLEKFLHNEEIQVPHLVRISISHYQFETIHPFCDGNGRIGRLMIPLYLISKNILRKPSLYISDFFEKNRAAYYDSLDRVRHTNDLTQWIKFFLNAVIATSEKGVETFSKILALKNEVDASIVTLGKRAKQAHAIMPLLYKQPVFNIKQIQEVIGLSPKSANDLVQGLVKTGLIKEITGYKRNRFFIFDKYIDVF